MVLRLALFASLGGVAACTVPLVNYDSGVHDAGTTDLGASATDFGSAVDGSDVDAPGADLGAPPDASDVDAVVGDAGPSDGAPVDFGCGVFGMGRTTWYADCDHDGFGGTTTTLSCGPPTTPTMCGGFGGMGGVWVTTGGDCDDGDPNAFPGQTMYFTVARVRFGGMGATSYDYDCDGAQTPEYPSGSGGPFGHCSGTPPAGMTCADLGTWLGGLAPACGASGTFRACMTLGTTCAPGTSSTITEPCR